ncbi:MAG: hypothetical protein WC371_01645, partial [Parachlamydiales bacterium]
KRVAFQAKKIVASYQKERLPGRIDRVLVSDAYLHISCDNPLCTENNWTKMMQKISKKEAGAPKQEVVIGDLSFDHLTIASENLGILPGSKEIKLSNLHFKNVSSQNGFPIQQLIIKVFRSAGIKNLMEDVFDKKGSIFQQMIKGMREDRYD